MCRSRICCEGGQGGVATAPEVSVIFMILRPGSGVPGRNPPSGSPADLSMFSLAIHSPIVHVKHPLEQVGRFRCVVTTCVRRTVGILLTDRGEHRFVPLR